VKPSAGCLFVATALTERQIERLPDNRLDAIKQRKQSGIID
jgi:hypothetical protein